MTSIKGIPPFHDIVDRKVIADGSGSLADILLTYHEDRYEDGTVDRWYIYISENGDGFGHHCNLSSESAMKHRFRRLEYSKTRPGAIVYSER